jgi:hypothetical protein
MKDQIRKINELKKCSFNSEDDVLIKYVIPFFSFFGYDAHMYKTKYPIQEYRVNRRGRKPEADCVFFSGHDHNFNSSLIVVETKRDEISNPIEQAKYYSDNLYTPFYITWEKFQFEIFQCKRFEPAISLGKFTLGEITAENFNKLLEILPPKKIVTYCEINEIKTIDLDKNRKEIESKYLNNLCSSLSNSFFLDLIRPLNVIDGFVQLYLSEYSVSCIDSEEIDKRVESGIHAKQIDGLSKKVKTVTDLETAINGNNKIAIIGDPGAGKTTLLKHICVENSFSDSSLFPVFIAIRDIFTLKEKISEAINEEIRKKGSTDNPKFISETVIKEGRLLLCVDGFDEIDIKDPIEARKILKEISNQLMEIHFQNPKNAIIISARTESWRICRKEISPIFKEFELLPFTPNNIRVFVTKWFENSDTALRNDLLDEFRYLGWPEFASNPLLLALTCYLFEKKGRLSNRMYKLYDKCIDLLLEEWASSRRISKREIVKELNSDIKKDILAEIALAFHYKGKATFSRIELIKELEEQLGKFGISSNQAGDVFEEFTSQHGLIKSWSFDDYYAFPHLVFQEYLSAKALRDKNEGYKDLIKRRNDPFWNNTLKIYSSMGDLSSFIGELLNENDNILHSNLFLAANCLSEGTKLSDKKLRNMIIEPLLDLAKSENKYFSESAITALVKIGDDSSDEILRKMYTNEKGNFIPDSFVLKYYFKIEGVSKTSDFIDFLFKNPKSSYYGIDALNWLPHSRVIHLLQYIIEYEDYNFEDQAQIENLKYLKRQSTRLFAKIGQDESLPLLLKMLNNRNNFSLNTYRNLIISISSVRNPKIPIILKKIADNINFSIDERITAISSLNTINDYKKFLLTILEKREIYDISRQIVLNIVRENSSNLDLDENNLDLFKNILCNTKYEDWRSPSIASDIIRIIGGLKAHTILEEANEIWQKTDHPKKLLIINSINVNLLWTENKVNLKKILEIYLKRDKVPIEWDLPTYVYQYYLSNPHEAKKFFIDVLATGPKDIIVGPYLGWAIIANFNKIQLDDDLLKTLIATALKIPEDKFTWKILSNVWHRQDLNPEMKKLFF